SPCWTSSRTCGPTSRPGPTTPYALSLSLFHYSLLFVIIYSLLITNPQMAMPSGRRDHRQVLGKATMNIGTFQGGLVPNIVPESAAARLSFRIVDPMQQIIERVTQGT